MKLLPAVNTITRADICSSCAGKCCKQAPGLFSPCDFGPSEKEMISAMTTALLSKRVAIDCWEGTFDDSEIDSPEFLRPALSGQEGVIHHASWGGRCTFLATGGCELEPEKRPAECRGLEPRPGGDDCDSHYGKAKAIRAWLPWQDAISSAVADMKT